MQQAPTETPDQHGELVEWAEERVREGDDAVGRSVTAAGLVPRARDGDLFWDADE